MNARSMRAIDIRMAAKYIGIEWACMNGGSLFDQAHFTARSDMWATVKHIIIGFASVERLCGVLDLVRSGSCND